MKRFIVIGNRPSQPSQTVAPNYLGCYDRAEQVLDNLVNLGSGPYGARLLEYGGIEVLDTHHQVFYELSSILDAPGRIGAWVAPYLVSISDKLPSKNKT